LSVTEKNYNTYFVAYAANRQEIMCRVADQKNGTPVMC